MSRCSICDYSQSAPSFYNEGLQYRQSNNRVVHTKDHGDICTSCLDDLNASSMSFADVISDGGTGVGVFDIVDIEYIEDNEDDSNLNVPAHDLDE